MRNGQKSLALFLVGPNTLEVVEDTAIHETTRTVVKNNSPESRKVWRLNSRGCLPSENHRLAIGVVNSSGSSSAVPVNDHDNDDIYQCGSVQKRALF